MPKTQEQPIISVDGGGDDPIPLGECASRNGDGDDYIKVGILEAELLANAPPTVIDVNRGVRRFEAFDPIKSTKLTEYLGIVGVRRAMPWFR